MSTKYLNATNPTNQALDLRTYDLTIDDRLFQPIPIAIQNTSFTNAVTCNAVSGKVITVSLTTAALDVFTFQINNNKVAFADVIQLTIQQYTGNMGTDGFPYVVSETAADGIINITVANLHPTNALAGALEIGFTVFSAL